MVQFLFYGDDLLRIYHERYQGRPFKIAFLTGWFVILNGGSEDVKIASKWPDSVALFFPVIDQILQLQFTIGTIVTKGQHLVALVNRLTRNMNSLTTELRAEVETSIRDTLSPTDKWQLYRVDDISLKIVSRVVTRMVVGEDLCRNQRFLDICIGYPKEVFKAAVLTNTFFPSLLRPLAPYVLCGTTPLVNEVMKMITPIIERSPCWRLSGSSSGGGQMKEKTSLDWIIDMADGDDDEYCLDSMVRRILHLSFASLHTSSITYQRVLYNLCRNPEYLVPLREEAEEAVVQDGWTKSALEKMKKLDSFIQETHRLMPLSNLQPARMIMQDHTLDDGTFLPQGTVVAFRTDSVHMDDTVYPDPDRFDGFRFYNMNLEGQKNSIITPSRNFTMFGIGKHACPGRFIAALEMKLLVSHLILNYDIKGPIGNTTSGTRSKYEVFQGNPHVPKDTGEILIRLRKDDSTSR